MIFVRCTESPFSLMLFNGQAGLVPPPHQKKNFLSIPNAVSFCPEEPEFCMEICFHVLVKRTIISLGRRGKTTLKSNGMVVVLTAL